MNNILKMDTDSIEKIKGEISQLETYLSNIDNQLTQCNSVSELNIELENIATLKKNIIKNINNLKNIINTLTSFTNNIQITSDNITQSLINLRNSYKKINTNK